MFKDHHTLFTITKRTVHTPHLTDDRRNNDPELFLESKGRGYDCRRHLEVFIIVKHMFPNAGVPY